MAPPLFAKLKFYVLPVNTLDIPRRAELVALLKAHGGEAVTRLEAISLGAAVMRLVVDAFAVPEKDTGIVRLARRGAGAAPPDPFPFGAGLLRRAVGLRKRQQGRAAGPRAVPAQAARRGARSHRRQAQVPAVRALPGALVRRV